VNLAAARLSFVGSLSDHAVIERELARVHLSPGPFVTMLVADATGAVVTASILDSRGVSHQVHSAMGSATANISGGRWPAGSPIFPTHFRDAASGRTLLFAISAPIFGSDGRVIGVVEGSCKVSSLDRQFLSSPYGDGSQLLLTDSHQRVIAGRDFGYQPLLPIADTPLGAFLRQSEAQEPARFVAESDGEPTVFLSVSLPVPNTGWQVTVLRPWSKIMAPIATGYATLIAAALVAGGFAGGLDRGVAPRTPPGV
jgi:hypothetical protein